MTGVGSDEIIALTKGKQSAFAKAVKRVKKSKAKGDEDAQAQAPKGQRGIIMLKHIPHGFYEKEIKSYFSQFGKVLRVRVGRSQKTGKSRGYAFVEFEFEEVAKIAAEAMNNYLMFERLIKCEVLASDVNAKKLFRLKYIREENYPKLLTRKKEKVKRDLELTEEEGKDILQQRLNKIKEQNKRLAKLGIEYEFKVAKTEDDEAAESGVETNDAEEEQEDDVADSDNDEDSEQDDAMEVDSNGDDSEEDDDSALEDLASLFPSPIKSKSPKVSNVGVSQKKKTPLQNKFSPNEDDSEEDNDSALEDLASLFPSPIKSKSPKVANVEVSQKKKTPLQHKFSPKLLRSRKSHGVPTPAVDTKRTPGKKARVSELPKISPKVLRSRKSQGQSLQTATPEIKSTPRKKDKNQGQIPQTPTPEIKSTPRKKYKNQEQTQHTPTPEIKSMPTPIKKDSPKPAKNRKSQGPNVQTPVAPEASKTPGKKIKSSDLPRISPKLLRSRKSEAVLTPVKQKSPPKAKKGGRKSVL